MKIKPSKREVKSFRNKYLALTIISLLFFGISQAQYLKPNNSYGTISNRQSIDSTLLVPTGCGDPSLRGVDLKKVALYGDTCNNLLYKYDPKTTTWNVIGSGTGMDTAFYSSSATADTIIGLKGNNRFVIGIFYNKDGLISGGIVTWDSLLTFDVTAAVYRKNAVVYNSPAGSITLDAADPTYNRIDLIVLDTTGNIRKVTGVPSANPAVPQIDPTYGIILTQVQVNANATTPANVSSSVVYDENTEFTTSAVNATVNFDNTVNPFHLTKAADVTAASSGGYLQFVSSTVLNSTDYNTIKFYIRLKTALAKRTSISVIFYNGSTNVSNGMVLSSTNGFDPTITGTYQNISIPMSDFNFSPSAFDRIRIVFNGSSFSSFYIDYVQLQAGVTNAGQDLNFVRNVYASGGNLYQTINGQNQLITPLAVGGGGISKLGISPYGLVKSNDSTYYADSTLLLTKLMAAATYLTPSNANATYLKISDTTNKWIPKGSVFPTYVTKPILALNDSTLAFDSLNLTEIRYSLTARDTTKWTDTTLIDRKFLDARINPVIASVSTNTTNIASNTTAIAGKLSNITGLVTAGTNVTVTGSGTSVSPYVINSSGGGGSGGSLTLQQVTTNGKVTTDTIQQQGAYLTGLPFATSDSLDIFGNSFESGYRPVTPDVTYIDKLKAIWGSPTTHNYASPSTGISYSIGKINTVHAATATSFVGAVAWNDIRSMTYYNDSGYRMIGGGYNSIFFAHFLGGYATAGTGTGVTRYGTWNTSLNTGAWMGKSGTSGASTPNPNDSIIYVNPSADSSIGVSLIGLNTNGANFDVYLDNNLVGHYTENSKASGIVDGTGTYDNKHVPFVIMFNNLPLKIHKLKLVKTSSTADTLYVDYFGQLRSASTSTPLILLKGIFNDSTGASITAVGSLMNAANIRYNQLIDSVSKTWNQNYPFFIINDQDYIDTLWGVNTVDHVHPGNLGDSAIALSVYNTIPSLVPSSYSNITSYGARRLNNTQNKVYTRQLAYYDEVLKTSDKSGLIQNTQNLQRANIALQGKIQYQDGNQNNGYVLTSDAKGNATWQASPASSSNPYIGQAITSATAGSLLFAGSGGKLSQMPTKFSIDTANTRIGIGVGASPLATLDLGNSSHTPAIKFNSTSASYLVGQPNVNLHFAIQNIGGTNVNSVVQIMPHGTGYSGYQSSFQLYATDYSSNQSNYSFLGLLAMSDKYTISSNKGGTGTILPIYFEGDGSGNFKQLAIATNSFIGINTQSPTSYLHDNGSFATAYTITAVSMTAGAANYTIEVTATGQTITLPTAVGITGRIYTVKLTASGTASIATTSSQVIDGSTTYSLSAQYKYVTVQSNGANWVVIANN